LISPAAQEARERPQAHTWLGYELLVSASHAGEELGRTRIRIAPGTIPALRLRATPVLAEAGKPFTLEVIRGPSFLGSLPKDLTLALESGTELKAPLDPRTRTASFALPEGVSGWMEARLGEARALAYVRPPSRLLLEVGAEQASYAPGQTARLVVHTSVGGKGTKAAVGLFGVDESLGQLAALPGPDEMARVRPAIAMREQAFGALDAQALAMGRIRGGNAAAATVLQVASLPARSELDAAVSASSSSPFDPGDELHDRFYGVLSELQAQVRAWEEAAPKDDRMHPGTMARLWEQALAACEKRGESVRDAYGRRLKLSLLPAPLLGLVDPRQVVVEGTRLPEDVESWAMYVEKEKP
jgi:hypothetical protein